MKVCTCGPWERLQDRPPDLRDTSKILLEFCWNAKVVLGSKKYFSSFRDQSGPVAAYLAWFLRKWLMRTSQENMALPWVWHVLHSIFIEIRVIAPPCNLCSNRSRERLPDIWDLLNRLWELKFGTRIILLPKPSGCPHARDTYILRATNKVHSNGCKATSRG